MTDGLAVETDGRGRELDLTEAVLWMMDADPNQRSSGMAISVLDCEPDWERLVDSQERLSRLVPRYRQRVVTPPLGLTPPAWVVDPDFDLSHHLRRERLDPPGSLRQVLDLAESMLEAGFDMNRPLWETVLVDGLEGGRAALMQKAHHIITDGQGGMRMMEDTNDPTRDPEPSSMPKAPAAEDPAPAMVLRHALCERLGLIPEAVRGAPRLLAATGRMALRPGQTWSKAVSATRPLRRLLDAGSVEPSPLLRARSHSNRFDLLEVSVEDLHRAARAAGASMNDAYLAALSGGLGQYHHRLGASVQQIPMGIPISIRTADDPTTSNRFAAAVVAAPIGVADPKERIVQLRQQVLAARAEPAGSGNALSGITKVVPFPVIAALVRTMTSRRTALDVQASNVAGLTKPVYTAGARIERMYPIGPLPGCAVMTVLLSYAGTCSIGINTDPAAVTEPDLLLTCLADGFDEILALGGSHDAPVRPAPPRRGPDPPPSMSPGAAAPGTLSAQPGKGDAWKRR